MSEKSNLEYVMEALKSQIEGMQDQKKRLEVRIKELTGQVEEAELEAQKKIAAARAKLDAEIAALKEEAAPYKELVQKCEAAKRELATLRQTMLDETANLTAQRHAAITQLDNRVKMLAEKLAKLQAEEDAFRKRVAMV